LVLQNGVQVTNEGALGISAAGYGILRKSLISAFLARAPASRKLRAARSLLIGLLFTLWGWRAGGLVGDDILEMTSEELNELVVLVARE